MSFQKQPKCPVVSFAHFQVELSGVQRPVWGVMGPLKVLRDRGPNGDHAAELMLLRDVNSIYIPTQ